MNFYKKIIRSRKLRFKILSALRFIPDEPMLKLQYRIKCGRKLNLKDPKRYTEKLQWYKLYYRDPVMQQCADKYQVREYVKSKGLSHILNDLYAVFDSPEDICLDSLPDQFVLKLSNGSGTNLLCQDKRLLDLEKVKQQFRDYYAQSGASAGREWVYNTGKKPVVIAEQYLEDSLCKDGSLCDYKIMCFDGEPYCIICHYDRLQDHKSNIYDLDWADFGVTGNYPRGENGVPKPDKLDEMLSIAGKLSQGFPSVRVDLYSINGNIYFGELTFFHCSGYVRYTPDSFDFDLGEKFKLPERNC